MAPQVLAKSSVKSNPHSDIRNLWTTATLSQPKLNVQLSNVYRDSELESSSVGSKTSEWYNRKNASHDSEGGWEESDDRDDNVSFKQEELDDHTLLELHPGSSFGSHLEEADDSSTEMGQCGLTGEWAPPGQGTGQGLIFCWCKTGRSCRIQVSRIPWEGRPALIYQALNRPDILGAPPTGKVSYKVPWPEHSSSGRHVRKCAKAAGVGPCFEWNHQDS